MVLDRHGRIEQDHHAVAGEMFDGSVVRHDRATEFGVVLAQHAHHLLRLGRLGEPGEAAQVDEHHGDLRAACLERVVRIARHDQVADLRREKPRELGHLPDLRHLLGDARFEPRIPFGDLRRLLLHLAVLVRISL